MICALALFVVAPLIGRRGSIQQLRGFTTIGNAAMASVCCVVLLMAGISWHKGTASAIPVAPSVSSSPADGASAGSTWEVVAQVSSAMAVMLSCYVG
jgi:hypothetical protein